MKATSHYHKFCRYYEPALNGHVDSHNGKTGGEMAICSTGQQKIREGHSARTRVYRGNGFRQKTPQEGTFVCRNQLSGEQVVEITLKG